VSVGSPRAAVSPNGRCTIAAAGLVSWWRGENNANDALGKHNGRFEGTEAYAPGKVGRAFLFDGASQVVVPDAHVWSFHRAFTIALWVNFDAIQGRDPFVGHDEGAGETNKWIFWFDRQGHPPAPAGDRLRFHLNSRNDIPYGPTDPIFAPWSPTTGRWYHVAITRNQSHRYSLYIDGVRAATRTNLKTIQNADFPLTIGAAEFYRLVGRLDEVTIWRRALRPWEVEALARTCQPGIS
jgi:hypothetical protein